MKRNKRGFALIYVIILMSLVSVYMAVLSRSALCMLRQTNRFKANAVEHNSHLSALERDRSESQANTE
jgi:type II secretory pathway pseudopilin PulG